LLVIPVLCLAGIALYNLPPLHNRLAWRVEGFRTQIRYALNPPDQAVFVPQEPLAEESLALEPLAQMVEATLQAMTPAPTLMPVQSGVYTCQYPANTHPYGARDPIPNGRAYASSHSLARAREPGGNPP
jgi:hypothetical protein